MLGGSDVRGFQRLSFKIMYAPFGSRVESAELPNDTRSRV